MKKDYFYESSTWARLRWKTLMEQGRKCRFCGTQKEGTVFHVDHIKPRSKFPELELDPKNLQVLCEPCNIGKSDDYFDDLSIEIKKTKMTALQNRRRMRLYGEKLVGIQKEIFFMKRRHFAAVRMSMGIKNKMTAADKINDEEGYKILASQFLSLQRILKDFESEYVSGKSKGDI